MLRATPSAPVINEASMKAAVIIFLVLCAVLSGCKKVNIVPWKKDAGSVWLHSIIESTDEVIKSEWNPDIIKKCLADFKFTPNVGEQRGLIPIYVRKQRHGSLSYYIFDIHGVDGPCVVYLVNVERKELIEKFYTRGD